MAERLWTVNGVGTHTEVYSEELQCWIQASSHAATLNGHVKVRGVTDRGENVQLKMGRGESWLVR